MCCQNDYTTPSFYMSLALCLWWWITELRNTGESRLCKEFCQLFCSSFRRHSWSVFINYETIIIWLFLKLNIICAPYFHVIWLYLKWFFHMLCSDFKSLACLFLEHMNMGGYFFLVAYLHTHTRPFVQSLFEIYGECKGGFLTPGLSSEG